MSARGMKVRILCMVSLPNHFCKSALSEFSPEVSAEDGVRRPLITPVIIPEKTESVSEAAGDNHPLA